MIGRAVPFRVLVVEACAVSRQAITDIVNESKHLEVVGVASDPLQAEQRVRRAAPDVILLDLEMPGLDATGLLRRLMAQRPVPVILRSSLAGRRTKALRQALETGAVDVLLKPQQDVKAGLEDMRRTICDTLRRSAMSGPKPLHEPSAPPPADRRLTADAMLPYVKPRIPADRAAGRVIAIGISTGGPKALDVLLGAMPPDCPPIVIVQHMPEGFTAALAQRLDNLCEISVSEARDGDLCQPGNALIAPGNRHLLLTRAGQGYGVFVRDGPPVSRHKPSVDVLFRSVAQEAGANAVGVIMTGMGDDGAQGLLEMRQAGAVTLGQAEASCVVYGMPKVAMRLGAVAQECDLGLLPKAIINEIQADRVA